MKITSFILMLMVSACYCKGQQTGNLTFRNKYKESRKYPDESKFAKKYLKLTEMTIALIDSIKAGMIRFYNDSSFLYLSSDSKIEKLFNGMKEMHSSALLEIEDAKLEGKINERLLEVLDSKNRTDWILKWFKGKSTIESLATLTELQTACLEFTDSVFDQMIKKRNKK